MGKLRIIEGEKFTLTPEESDALGRLWDEGERHKPAIDYFLERAQADSERRRYSEKR